MQAINATRPGGHMGFVGVNYEVAIPGIDLFRRHPRPRWSRPRAALPELIQQMWDREIDPGKVFDLTLPLDQAAEGYEAMDERRSTKVLLTLYAG